MGFYNPRYPVFMCISPFLVFIRIKPVVVCMGFGGGGTAEQSGFSKGIKWYRSRNGEDKERPLRVLRGVATIDATNSMRDRLMDENKSERDMKTDKIAGTNEKTVPFVGTVLPYSLIYYNFSRYKMKERTTGCNVRCTLFSIPLSNTEEPFKEAHEFCDNALLLLGAIPSAKA